MDPGSDSGLLGGGGLHCCPTWLGGRGRGWSTKASVRFGYVRAALHPHGLDSAFWTLTYKKAFCICHLRFPRSLPKNHCLSHTRTPTPRRSLRHFLTRLNCVFFAFLCVCVCFVWGFFLTVILVSLELRRDARGSLRDGERARSWCVMNEGRRRLLGKESGFNMSAWGWGGQQQWSWVGGYVRDGTW